MEVEEPLVERIGTEKLSSEVGLPPYLDLRNKSMKRAVAILWGSGKALQLFGQDARSMGIRDALKPLMFGSGAIKMLCPVANDCSSPFYRELGDLDFVVPKRTGDGFVNMLCSLGTKLGTQYTFFLTRGDRTFNALRGGARYRVRMLEGIADGTPDIKDIDVFSSGIELRHQINFDMEFDERMNTMHTIGAEKLLLSKLQVINEVPSSDMPAIEHQGQSFRVLNYEHYRSDRLLIGVEGKDMLDACSLLHDRGPIAGNDYHMDSSRISDILGRDLKFALTVKLNLENICRHTGWLKEKGMSSSQVSKIVENASALLSALPDIRKKWSKPWWNTLVETPIIT